MDESNRGCRTFCLSGVRVFCHFLDGEMKQTISVIITDLDNTLYDWLGIWHSSFKAMLDRLVIDSGVPSEILIPEFKRIHEKYGTAEYSFSIQGLPSLQKNFPNEDLAKRFEGAIKAYRDGRTASMELYPQVLETLETLKDKGCLLVGYTESAEYYTARRVKKFGLDRILDHVWSPLDSELPNGLTPSQVRSRPEEYYQLRRTVHHTLPKGELKPNPGVLAQIMNDVGATPEETLYLGDSLMKDILMAQRAGVTDVWAKYGVAQDRPEYELLRKVTHWTAADVEREKKLARGDVKPTYVLEKGIDQILPIFSFTSFLSKSSEHLSSVLDVWKQTVDVQKHFNDLELTVRNYAVTVLAALLGLGGYALKGGFQTTLFGHTASVASLILLFAILPLLTFYIMDRWWYHRLLLGAVEHGMFIENRWGRFIPEIRLTCAISKRSPVKISRLRPMHTNTKIDICYLLVLLLILLLAWGANHAVHPSALSPVSP